MKWIEPSEVGSYIVFEIFIDTVSDEPPPNTETRLRTEAIRIARAFLAEQAEQTGDHGGDRNHG
jgi:hypothetical protein